MVLTGIVACFVAAYTINIGNQDSYGILNLRKIYLRNGPNETITGIALDGETYTISVAKGQPTDTGKIEVYQICGRTGGDCKKVSELVSVSGSNLSSGGYCKYIDEQRIPQGHGLPDIVVPAHFECNTTNPYTLPLADNGTTGGIKLGYQTGDRTYPVVLDSNGKAYVLVPWEDNNTRQINTSGQDGYVSAPGNKTNKVRKVDANGSVGWKDDNNTRQINTSGQDGYVSAPGVKTNKVRKVDSDGNVGWKDDTNTHYTDSLTIKGGDNIAVVFNQTGSKTLYITGGGGITVTTGSAGYIIISGAAGGGGGGLWELAGEEETSPIRPKNEKNITFSQTNATITHNGSLTINNGGTYTSPNSNITFDSKGMRLGLGTYTGAGLGINGGPVVIGSFSSCSSNGISMAASGNSMENSHFEILGNTRLLVGTYGKSYIYFDENNSVGINTTSINSTLTVRGSIQIGSCGTSLCNGSTIGQLRYIVSGNTGHFLGCIYLSGNSKINNVNAKNYAWIKLTDGTKRNTVVPADDSCDITEPYANDIYSSMVASHGGACTE